MALAPRSREPYQGRSMQLRPLCTPEVAVNAHGHAGEAYAVRCKRWSCPVCAEVNRRRVIRIAKDAKPRALLTLTVSSKDYPEPQQAAEALKKGLRLLRLRLARDKKLENFEFLAVFEKHASGSPHLHLLIKGSFIPWQWLRKVWEEVTGSYMVDIRKIDTVGKAALYCAKYIGKDLSAFAGCKRWWRSHGYSDGADDDYSADRPQKKFERTMIGFYAMVEAVEEAGWIVERQRGERFAWSAPPDRALPPSWRECLATARPFPSPWGDGYRSGDGYAAADVRGRGRRTSPPFPE